MQYIDYTQPQKRASKDQTTSSHSTYRMAKHNQYAAHKPDSKRI